MRVLEGVTSPFRQGGRAIREWVKCQLVSVNETPIFVLGNQKSGTTAIAILLAKRADLSVEWDLTTIEHGSLINEIYREKASIERLINQNRLAFSREVIKDPNLTFCYSKLEDRFPEAKFVMVVRHPCDNIRSILDRLSLPGNKSRIKSEQYNNIPDGWRVMLKGGWTKNEGENYIENLAIRWKKAVSIYMNNKDKIELIKYENFCENKIGSIDNLSERLNIDKVKSIKDEIDRQFQPRGGNRSIRLGEFFGDKNIEIIENICRKEINKLGYIK